MYRPSLPLFPPHPPTYPRTQPTPTPSAYSTHVPTHVPLYLRSYLPINVPTYIHTYIKHRTHARIPAQPSPVQPVAPWRLRTRRTRATAICAQATRANLRNRLRSLGAGRDAPRDYTRDARSEKIGTLEHEGNCENFFFRDRAGGGGLGCIGLGLGCVGWTQVGTRYVGM